MQVLRTVRIYHGVDRTGENEAKRPVENFYDYGEIPKDSGGLTAILRKILP